MNFEWYNPKKITLKVSISGHGITFYNDVAETMGSPEHIILGFNETNKVIAVKCCDKPEEDSLGFISKKRNNSYVRISDKNFIRFIQSRLSEDFDTSRKTKVFLSEWDEQAKTLYIFLQKHLA